MKKRLRKKLHIGEFQELGFSLSFTLKGEQTPEELESFVELFLTHAIDPQGLCYAGSGSQTQWDGLVMLNAMGSVSEEQRKSVISWFEKAENVENLDASELLDVWYE